MQGVGVASSTDVSLEADHLAPAWFALQSVVAGGGDDDDRAARAADPSVQLSDLFRLFLHAHQRALLLLLHPPPLVKGRDGDGNDDGGDDPGVTLNL